MKGAIGKSVSRMRPSQSPTDRDNPLPISFHQVIASSNYTISASRGNYRTEAYNRAAAAVTQEREGCWWGNHLQKGEIGAAPSQQGERWGRAPPALWHQAVLIILMHTGLAVSSSPLCAGLGSQRSSAGSELSCGHAGGDIHSLQG